MASDKFERTLYGKIVTKQLTLSEGGDLFARGFDVAVLIGASGALCGVVFLSLLASMLNFEGGIPLWAVGAAGFTTFALAVRRALQIDAFLEQKRKVLSNGN